jgi:hypothetical protein
MATFAITAIFEALIEPTTHPSSLRRVEPLSVVATIGEPVQFCAFTADTVRVVDDHSLRDVSQQRNPDFVSWLRRKGGESGPAGLGTDHRAA